MERMFRFLREDEIEVKVKQVKQNGISCLLYKTSRTDMDLLDETVGPMNWDSDYKVIKDNLYCGIGIWDEKRQKMAWKWDCGIESREDAEGNQKKGEASDAFKRAGFKWGIGRELYTSPFIWITSDKCQIKNGKCYDKFHVEKISFDDCGRCNGLSIWNDSTDRKAFEFRQKEGHKQADADPTIHEKQHHICKKCGKSVTGVQFKSGGQYTEEQILQMSNEHFGCDMCWKCMKNSGKNDGPDDESEGIAHAAKNGG